MGPAPATRKALERAGLTLDRHRSRSRSTKRSPASTSRSRRSSASIATRSNVNGGAIALGHPLGMTGTRLLLTLTLELAPPRQEVRPRHGVHRRRTGHRGDCREDDRKSEFEVSRRPEFSQLDRTRVRHGMIKTVGVLGCGLMGAGIAQVSAAAGFKTIVREVNEGVLDKGLGRIEKFLTTASRRARSRPRIATRRSATSRDDRRTRDLKDCDLVIEAIVENVDDKKQAYAQVEARRRPARASSRRTPRRSASPSWRRRRSGPDRFGGLHFFNPVPLMKLVEVVRALTTSQETYDALYRVSRRRSARSRSPRPTSGGFIVNRLLVPYLLDAIRCFEEGLGTVEDIDKGMKLGCGYPMGPLHAARLRRPRHDLLHREHHVRRIPRDAVRAAAAAEADGARRTSRQEDRPRASTTTRSVAERRATKTSKTEVRMPS